VRKTTIFNRQPTSTHKHLMCWTEACWRWW